MPRKVVLFIAASLDGCIAGPRGEIDWLFDDQDYGYAAFYSGVELLAMGRRTYAACAAFPDWPYPGKPCHVFTRSQALAPDPRIAPCRDDPAVFVARERDRGEGTIWLVGGAELAGAFLERDLVDEIVLSIHPLVLGAGIPLVRGLTARRGFALLDCRRFDSGLVQLSYRRP
jgi:dihydrofolate reductase